MGKSKKMLNYLPLLKAYHILYIGLVKHALFSVQKKTKYKKNGQGNETLTVKIKI